jgi:hypothetical protein
VTGWLDYDDFSGRVGETFVATALGDEGAAPVPLTLVEATQHDALGGPGPDGVQRRQFSLVFGGPVEQPLAQSTYDLAHDGLGTIALFLVPIGAGRYETSFA